MAMTSMNTPAGQSSSNNNNNKNRNSPPKTRTPSPKATPLKKQPIHQTPTKSSTSATHFCSSVFLNSPDPSALPMPIFDDEDEEEEEMVKKSTNVVVNVIVNKTDTLRQFLNMHPALSTPITA